MRVYLAATSSGMPKDLKKKTIDLCKPRYILETFFNGENKCLDAMGIVGNDNFLLDSGAFSYMNGAKTTLQQLDEYVNRYIDFIIRNNVKYFFEIDVDNIFGLPQVETWRHKVEKAVGYQCIPVWHKGRGVEYWKQMCDKYSYIAVGGFAIRKIKTAEYELIRKLIEYAYFRGVKVHGLGFTKTKELKKYKFYSVDSTTWTVAAARGQQIHIFKNGCIESRRLNKGNKKVNLSKLVAHNMIEWTKFQKYMDTRRF